MGAAGTQTPRFRQDWGISLRGGNGARAAPNPKNLPRTQKLYRGRHQTQADKKQP